MAIFINIVLNEGLYLKNPQQSELGKKIIQNSIILIDELGFESFNFKKLAIKIESTEASVYRYFENKHMLLLYLVSWYWEWVNYLIQFNTHNIVDPKRKMNIFLETLVTASKENTMVDFVNESILHRIIIHEGSKAYHTKKVDKENRTGFFTSYNELVGRISDFILELCPDFKYPHAMASDLFEMANNQIYFALHMPELTDVQDDGKDHHEVLSMLQYFVEKLLA